jgi:membrane protease YdiL (CAAX protease family)
LIPEGDLGMVVFNRYGDIRNGYKIIGFIILLVIALTMAHFLPLSDSMQSWALVAVALVVSWLCLKLEKEPLASIGLRINAKFIAEFFAGTLLGVALICAAMAGAVFFGGIAMLRNPELSVGDLLYVLVPFLAISAWEELLFRGYIFQRAIRGIGSSGALLLFALLFVLLHWGNPGMEGSTKLWASLNIGLASVLLGLAWIKTKSLAMPVGIHLGWNWAQGSLLGFGVSGTKSKGFWGPAFGDAPQWLTGGSFGLEASLPGCIACLLACVVFMIWKPKQSKG